jgi:hypothetical protein
MCTTSEECKTEKPSRSFHGLIVMSRIRIQTSPSWQVAGVAWRAVTRIMAGVGDSVQRTGDGRIGRVLGGRAIERSGGTVCGLHRARGDEECGFLG